MNKGYFGFKDGEEVLINSLALVPAAKGIIRGASSNFPFASKKFKDCPSRMWIVELIDIKEDSYNFYPFKMVTIQEDFLDKSN